MGEAGLAGVTDEREALGPVVFELELAPRRVDDRRWVADVPDLALEMLVAAVHALPEAVVEAAEVPAPLAVDPAEVIELVVANETLDIGQPKRTAGDAPAAL